MLFVQHNIRQSLELIALCTCEPRGGYPAQGDGVRVLPGTLAGKGNTGLDEPVPSTRAFTEGDNAGLNKPTPSGRTPRQDVVCAIRTGTRYR